MKLITTTAIAAIGILAVSASAEPFSGDIETCKTSSRCAVFFPNEDTTLEEVLDWLNRNAKYEPIWKLEEIIRIDANAAGDIDGSFLFRKGQEYSIYY